MAWWDAEELKPKRNRSDMYKVAFPDEYDAAESFGYIDLDGQTFVKGCEGCSKALAKYEQFIWNNRGYIREYLKIRVDQGKAWYEQEKLLNIIAGISPAAK